MKNKYMPKYIRIIACVAIILTLFICAFFIINKVESQRAIMRLYLYGDMTEMHEKSDVRSIAAMFMNGEKRVICHATIKLQGTSSLSYDKKNYTIKFYGDYAHNNKKLIDVGWGPENEETLMKFARLSDFILHSTDEEFKEDFDQYIDLDAMLNYFVLSEFAYMLDNFGKNMLVATYDGAVWYPSLYDLDTSWGTHYSGLELWAYQSNLTNFGNTNNLANRVQTLFAQELHDRYFELREDLLTKAHVLELFNEFDNGIPEDAKAREIKQWGDDIPGYDFSQIEDYLESVIERLDEKYQKLVN